MLPIKDVPRQAFDMLSLIQPPERVSVENDMDRKSYKSLNEPKRCLESIGGSNSAFTALKTEKGQFGRNGTLHQMKCEDFQHKRLHLDTFPMNRVFPVTSVFAGIMQRRKRRENRIRRQRTTFTSEQTLKLEVEYNRSEYISRPRRYELAEVLSLSESQIKIWFQNRRAKEKRIEKAHVDHQIRNCESVSANLSSGLSVQSPYSMLYGSCFWPYPPSTMGDIYPEKGS